MSHLNQTWDTPVYDEPVRFRPLRRHHALSISLALAVIATGVSGTVVYHRLDTLSDLDTYVAMGPSQSHIAADHAASEPTLLLTLTPPVYAAVATTRYDFPGAAPMAVPLTAHVSAADASAISEHIADDSEAKAAETAAGDDIRATAAETPVAADSLPTDPDPVAELLSEESLADSAK